MTIILDFRFAIFDWGRGAKSPRYFCRADSDDFRPCVFAASRLGVKPVKVAEQAAKFAAFDDDPSWQKVNLAGEFSDDMWRRVPAIVSRCQINSLIVTYC
jgi:hypothetical protein